ncbi:hypothetical protein VDGD_20141 [Verticillium dahliae]|nr:hypothetical protein VDGD_20141 [Verticillium dahliae]
MAAASASASASGGLTASSSSSSSSSSSRLGLHAAGGGAADALVGKAPVAVEDAQRQAAARLVGAGLKGGLADEAGVEGAAHGPDVDLCVDDGAGLDVEELGGAVGHGRVLGGRVLGLQGQGRRRDGQRARGEGAEVHEDGRVARVGDHDVAGLDVAVGVRRGRGGATAAAGLRRGVRGRGHEGRLLGLGVLVVGDAGAAAARAVALVVLVAVAHLHGFRGGAGGRGGGGAGVVVHGAQGAADAEEEEHEAALGKGGVVDGVGVDEVLEVAALVVGQQDVDCLGAGVVAAAAALRGDGVVHGVDDAWGAAEEAVGVDLAHGLGDRLGAKGTADLLEGVLRLCGCVLDEVDVGEAALEGQVSS